MGERISVLTHMDFRRNHLHLFKHTLFRICKNTMYLLHPIHPIHTILLSIYLDIHSFIPLFIHLIMHYTVLIFYFISIYLYIYLYLSLFIFLFFSVSFILIHCFQCGGSLLHQSFMPICFG